MKALILAAGRSRRLGTLTDECPKSCLAIKDNHKIIDLSLQNLHTLGFDEVTLVTGHAEEVLKKIVTENWSDKFQEINFVFNPDYLTKNNICTLEMVRDKIDNNTFIMNSDIIYDPRILEAAVKAFQFNIGSFLVVDDTKELVDEDMKVQTEGAYITRINKNISNEDSIGEYIGIMQLSGNDIELVRESLSNMVEAGETDMYYEDALDRIAEKLQLNIVSTEGHTWAEIDTVEDYERAKGLPCVNLAFQNS